MSATAPRASTHPALIMITIWYIKIDGIDQITGRAYKACRRFALARTRRANRYCVDCGARLVYYPRLSNPKAPN